MLIFNNSDHSSSKVFGVEQKIVRFSNSFNIDNLSVAHSSLTAFGDTERDNHY